VTTRPSAPLVVDASVVVAALVDDGPAGSWAAETMLDRFLAAPAHLGVEVASALRRLAASGAIGADVATLAHADLLDLRVQTYPYAPFGERVWALRSVVSTYDGAYLALAEALDAPLATLDGRLARTPGVVCAITTWDP
jgi:predicted nucleic acid-binding protein